MANKILPVVLIIVIGASSCAGLFYPRKAQADADTTAAVETLHTTTIGSWIKEFANDVKDYAIKLKDYAVALGQWLDKKHDSLLRTALAVFRRTLLSIMTDEIVKWIQGGGQPNFVTDWRQFMLDAADAAGVQVLRELEKQGEIPAGLTGALCSPNWAIQLKLALGTPKTFTQKSRCTLSDIGANFTDFMNDFQNGGWKAWIKITTQSQNNPYGLYMDTYAEKILREEQAKEAAAQNAQAGNGFLSIRVCKRWYCAGDDDFITGSIKEGNLPAECSCDKWEVQTPGKILADSLAKGIMKDIDWLGTNEEWESYVVAITDALINRLVTEGVLAITSADARGSGGTYSASVARTGLSDNTAPTSSAEPSDAWHIAIASNEETFVFYTLDGTEPTTSSLPYTGPIEITENTTLKWLAMDYHANQGITQTIFLSPPFSTSQIAPSSVAMAVSATGIALVVKQPATIYYTLDGSDPTTASSRYIKKLENITAITPIKWFSVNPQGTRERTIHEIAPIPPFPSYDLPQIVNLVEPIPAIQTSGIATIGNPFSLDPSSSRDNDDTPRIVMYEWDFDNDRQYDWWTVDWNRDGVFDESQCKDGTPLCSGGNFPIGGLGMVGFVSGARVGAGFSEMTIPAGAAPGTVSVTYSTRGQKTIGLRVTDDEGLYAKTAVNINIQ